jgi:pSer/pThr/pTyr-binding forkhead associated (FHA) protein
MPISRKHAVIVAAHGGYRLEDLQTRGGTLVNGVKCIGPTELKDQDVIRIANVRMRFYLIQS